MSRLVMGCMTFVTHASHVSTVLAMVRVCLSLSVTSCSSVETSGQIKMVFGVEAFLDLSYSVF